MTDENTSAKVIKTVDESKTAKVTSTKGKATIKTKGTTTKSKTQKSDKAKKVTKTLKRKSENQSKGAKKSLKQMKSKKIPQTKDARAMRALCNKVLTSKAGIKAGLTLVENGHGAIQIKREDGLMFSFRKTGRGCIITHPIFKGKDRWMKHSGTKWDHLTDCQWGDVTEKMLIARIKDTKSAKNYFEEIYKGKKKEKSGLFLKAEAAKARLTKAAKSVKKSTNKKKREKTKTNKASTVIKRQAKKSKSKKPVSSVITKVAASVA